MSSTDPARDQAKLAAVRAFFDKELMPLAAKLKGAGRPMFPAGADPAAATYFKTRAKTTMAKEDFVVNGVESPAAFATSLKAYWQSSRFPEMAVLAPSMGRLAEQLRGEPERDEEVSPFIYVMF
jgi:hypothetical protein